MKFGIRWRPITRAGDAPISSAACTKSSSRNASSLPRTARARPGQSSRPRMMVMPKNTQSGLQLGGSAADRASQSGSSGNERTTSISRCTAASTRPPK